MENIANLDLTATVGKRQFQVESWQQVSNAYRSMIEQLGIGASSAPRCIIRDPNGVIRAHVSYNGKVWAGERWTEGAKPIYSPY